MNKKGFTLTELLASITILALISTIAGFTYTKIMKDNKIKQCEQKILFIEKQAIKLASDYSIMHRGDTTISLSDSTNSITKILKEKYLVCDTEDECDYYNPIKGDYFKGSIKLIRNGESVIAKYGSDNNDNGVNDDCE